MNRATQLIALATAAALTALILVLFARMADAQSTGRLVQQGPLIFQSHREAPIFSVSGPGETLNVWSLEKLNGMDGCRVTDARPTPDGGYRVTRVWDTGITLFSLPPKQVVLVWREYYTVEFGAIVFERVEQGRFIPAQNQPAKFEWKNK